jgi:hypothetical protein
MRLTDAVNFLTHINSSFDTKITSAVKGIAAIELVHQVPTEGILEVVKIALQLVVALVAIFGKKKDKTPKNPSQENLRKEE